MTSEIRTNSLKSRAGLSTVTFTDSGPMFSGITTFVDNSGFNIGTGSSIFSPATNTLTLGTNSNERLRISSNGDVRIGAGSPATFGSGTTVHETYNANTYTANLVTSGTHQLQMIASQTHGATSIGTRSNHNLNLCANDSTKLTIDTSGRVLVNTATTYSSNQIMIVKGASPTGGGNRPYDGQLAIESTETSGAINTGGVLAFIGHDGGTARGFGSIRNLKEDGTSGNYGTYMSFETRANGSAPAEKVRITSDGKVGINVNNPSQALHVAGSIINSTSVNSTGDQGIGLGNGHRLGFDQSGTRSWTMKAASGNLTFNSGDGNGGFDFNTTAHLKLPSGTTAQRVNTTGAIRYNNGLGNLEFYDGSNWKRVKVLESAPTSGLLAYWPFSSASRSGSTYNDESGNNQDLTVYGTITDDTTESKFSGCIDFGTADGNDYLKTSSNSFTDIDASAGFTGVSISVWVKTSGTQNQWIISEGIVNTKWAFFNESANAPKWRSTTGFDIIQTGSILDGNWHHLVVTYNHSNRLVQHYRDGSFINQGTVGAQASFSGQYLLVGQHSSLTGNASSYRWRGKMAHMRLYNRVLTTTEVDNLYQQW